MGAINEKGKPIIVIVVVTTVLILMIAFGITIGIVSADPDRLERMIEDAGVEEPAGFFEPLLAWIQNEYIVAIVGILLIIGITLTTFYLIGFIKKQKINEESIKT